MPSDRTAAHATLAAATVFAIGGAALAVTGCGNDRITADAHRTLGRQLGAVTAGTADHRQAASADDLMAARRYLEATLRLDPSNGGARAALAGLGGPPDPDLPFPNLAPIPGPIATRTHGRRAVSFGDVAFGMAGAIGADIAEAVRPWATGSALARPAGQGALDSTRSIAGLAGTSDSAGQSRPAPRASAHDRAANRRRGTLELETAIAARTDDGDAPSGTAMPDAAPGATQEPAADPVAKPHHKRTWPWTRAQRWLVAKGLGGGAGAGVVIGALVGNVPGALIAGSLTGGALGFRKATKIGPAAPYPSRSDSVAFEQNRRRHDTERAARAPADTSARLAVGRP